MKYTTSAALAALLTIGAANAAVSWTGVTDGTGDIETATNWTGDVLPATGVEVGTITDTSVQFTAQQPASMTISFDGTTSLKNNQNGAVRIGNSAYTFNDTSSFDVRGADGNRDVMVWGRGADGGSTMIWNSTGTIGGLNDLRLGNNTAQLGFITQNAGLFEIGDTLQMKFGSTFTMAGGLLEADNLVIDNTDGADDVLNFVTTGTGGTMSFRNGGADYTSVLEAFITAGDIRINGAAATTADFNVSFDGSETSITVVPEPSSAALLGLGGLALIMRRRK